MNAFTIKDLENISGIKAHTIRIWEQRYSFLNPQRTDTNIRYYSNEELKIILNISLLNRYGFKISHIDKMTSDEMKEKMLSFTQIQAQHERLINELIVTMVDMNIEAFESILDSFIMSKGIEKTITQIIFPFLERIGILWISSHINAGQEHLVTNIVRQKIIVGIETTQLSNTNGKTVLLFLPEGEHHELGILFTYFLLKSRGTKVIYVGANVPMKDVEFIVNLKKPDFMYSHLTSIAHNFNFEKFLLNAHNRMPHTDLVVSGAITQSYKKRIPPNVYFKTSLSDVMDYLTSL